MLYILIILIVITFIGVIWAFKKQQKNKKQTTSDPVVDPIFILNSDILQANFILRKECKYSDIVSISEEILDSIHILFPKVFEINPAGNAAFTLKSMPKHYLMDKCILPYLRLSDELKNDESHINTILESLQTLKQEVSEIETILNRNDVQELEQKAEFINRKFK